MSNRKTTQAVSNVIKPPISFKEFSKDPVKGLMFICIVAVGYLYIDIKMSNKEIQEKQEIRINKFESKVDTLQLQIVNLVSEASATNAKIELLESLNKIPK